MCQNLSFNTTCLKNKQRLLKMTQAAQVYYVQTWNFLSGPGIPVRGFSKSNVVQGTRLKVESLLPSTFQSATTVRLPLDPCAYKGLSVCVLGGGGI